MLWSTFSLISALVTGVFVTVTPWSLSILASFLSDSWETLLYIQTTKTGEASYGMFFTDITTSSAPRDSPNFFYYLFPSTRNLLATKSCLVQYMLPRYLVSRHAILTADYRTDQILRYTHSHSLFFIRQRTFCNSFFSSRFLDLYPNSDLCPCSCVDLGLSSLHATLLIDAVHIWINILHSPLVWLYPILVFLSTM